MTPENISSMKSVLSTLILGEDLSDEQTSFAMEQILQGQCDDAQIAAFITLLRAKGETANEFSSMVRTMWDNTPEVPADDMTDVIDTCGTGGDQSGTFNISTAASLVLASCSIRVAKHGNRAMSSQCGAADVLEAVGIPVGSTPEQCEKMFNETGFTFLLPPLSIPVCVSPDLCAHRWPFAQHLISSVHFRIRIMPVFDSMGSRIHLSFLSMQRR